MEAEKLVKLTRNLTNNENARPGPGFADALNAALADLTPQEREVITLRYGLNGGEPRTLAEIGERWGVSRERVRQIEARAMRRLRHPDAGLMGRVVIEAINEPEPEGRSGATPLTEEAINDALRKWYAEQSRLWQAFGETLTEEQRALLRSYRQACRTVAKLRQWRDRVRRGKAVRREIPWP